MWGGDGTGQRVLACSKGAIGSEGFDGLMVRYSPGTLDNLPQATIAWLRDARPDLDQVVMTFYDRPAEADQDRAATTRLFCVPFSQLAAGPVGYLALFDELRKLEPAAGSRAPIVAELPVRTFTELADDCDPLARRVAATLLTARRVCVLGAEGLDLRERVRFVDTVAALLPYGLRSRLSASTLVSSTFDHHRMRLFFAAEQRQPDDHERTTVHWGRRYDEPIGSATADYYLWMLSNGTLGPDRLAECTQQTAFHEDDIGKVIELLAVRPEAGRSTRPAQDGDSPRRAAEARDETDIDHLLRFCAQSAGGSTAELSVAVSMLRHHLDKPGTRAQRQRNAELIEHLGLLRGDRDASDPDTELLGDFYDALLRLAFSTPLNYESYCMIEAASGRSPGQPMSALLSRAMLRVGLEAPLRLLVAKAVGEAEFKQVMGDPDTAPEVIVMMAANPRVRPPHARALCEIIGTDLPGQHGHAYRRLLTSALSKCGYLAPTAQRLFPDDPQAQLGLLGGILRAAHGSRLDSPAVLSVLGDGPVMPTVPLLAATIQLASPRDVQVAAARFAAHHIAAANFGKPDSERLEALLQGPRVKNGDASGENPGIRKYRRR